MLTLIRAMGLVSGMIFSLTGCAEQQISTKTEIIYLLPPESMIFITPPPQMDTVKSRDDLRAYNIDFTTWAMSLYTQMLALYSWREQHEIRDQRATN